MADKARGYLVDLAAATVTICTTTLLKKATGRTDTLFSIALGNFFANFSKNAFMGTQSGIAQNLAIEPIRGGFALQWRAAF